MTTARMKMALVTLLAALVMFGPAVPATACVGKTLMIGSTGTPQQEILAEVLSLLISERTGTTVKVVRFASTAEAHKALMAADLDMYVGYTGVGQVEVLGGEAIADADALYQAVKERYNRELNLVWLKPLGFDEPRVAPAGTTAQAAPVVRKDTLKKFPALARLINKLAGAIDDEAMRQMEGQVTGADGNVHDVARAFLKEGRLI